MQAGGMNFLTIPKATRTTKMRRTRKGKTMKKKPPLKTGDFKHFCALIRHGEKGGKIPESDKKNNDHVDVPLNVNGIEQAKKTG